MLFRSVPMPAAYNPFLSFLLVLLCSLPSLLPPSCPPRYRGTQKGPGSFLQGLAFFLSLRIFAYGRAIQLRLYSLLPAKEKSSETVSYFRASILPQRMYGFLLLISFIDLFHQSLLSIRVISSSIQTILSVLESHQILRSRARGLYRRSGISPCPEDYI